MLTRFDKTMLDSGDYEFRSMHDAAAKSSRAEEQVDMLHNCCVALVEVVRSAGQVAPPLAQRAAAMDEARSSDTRQWHTSWFGESVDLVRVNRV